MDELLPCPFCGTAERDDNQERGLDAWLQVASHGGHAEGSYWNVECFGCGIETRHVETPVAAIAAWNRRAAAECPAFLPGDPSTCPRDDCNDCPAAQPTGSLKLTVISKVVEGNFRPVIMAAPGDDNFPDPSPQPRFLTPDEAVDLVAEHGRLAERVRELEAGLMAETATLKAIQADRARIRRELLDAGHITEAQYWVGVARRDERARIRRELVDWLIGDLGPQDAGLIQGRRVVDEINRIAPEEEG